VTRKTARLSRFGRAETSSATVTRATYASLSHFCRKLFFAAPVSALPFLSTAFGSQASRLHFVKKLVLAAPVCAIRRSLGTFRWVIPVRLSLRLLLLLLYRTWPHLLVVELHDRLIKGDTPFGVHRPLQEFYCPRRKLGHVVGIAGG